MALTVVAGIGVAGLALYLVLRDGDAPSPTSPDTALRRAPPAIQPGSPASSRPVNRAPAPAIPRADAARAETSAPPPECTLRITSMTRFEPDNVVVGVEDRLSRKTQVMRIGDQADGGWRLDAVDFERESAVFEQNGIRRTVFLERGLQPMPQPAEAAPRAVAGGDAREESPETARAVRHYTTAFSNRVLQVEGSTDVAVNGVAHAPDIVEIKTSGTSFALRREIAENILNLDTISPGQKLQMLLTYPGVAIVESGQDPARQTADAEASLAATLANPPGEKPSVEDLDRLVKELPEIPPPPAEPAKTP